MKRLLFALILLGSVALPVCSKTDIYVVAVGIADYKSIVDLRLPEQDAKSIAELYKTKTKNVMLITGRYATRARIQKALRDQFSRADGDDMVVFFFSGHGYQGGICPYDMTNQPSSGITYKDLRSIMKQSRARHKVVLADACFSGGIRGGGGSATASSKDSDVMLFLSSRSGETSIESPFMVNGFFTSFLLRGLRGGADTNHDRKITAKELFTFVHQGVVEKSDGRQHPVMWGQFDDHWVLMDWR